MCSLDSASYDVFVLAISITNNRVKTPTTWRKFALQRFHPYGTLYIVLVFGALVQYRFKTTDNIEPAQQPTSIDLFSPYIAILECEYFTHTHVLCTYAIGLRVGDGRRFRIESVAAL